MTSSLCRFERAVDLPTPADEAYRWHERPGALERLLPPWMRVRVLERVGDLATGRVRLEIRIGPARLRWTAQHRDGVPGRRFVDVQQEGPFAHWEHTHDIEPRDASASRLTDRIAFAPPGGTLGRLLAGGFVARALARTFAFRHDVTRGDLAAHARFPGARPLDVAVTGASGFLGSALVPFLTAGGHRVRAVVRSEPGTGEVAWDPAAGRIDAAALEGVDAVVHLAGEGLATRRWSPAHREAVRSSRVEGTGLLAGGLAGLARPPAVLVCASAVGIYGSRGDEVLDEEAPTGTGFLADVGRAWEAAADPAREAGIRVVHLRFGIILSPSGGALATMLLPFRLGIGGRLGSGRQWMPWISLDDAVGVIHHAMLSDALAGPVNAVSPRPVTNAAFTRTLGRVLRRPTVATVPAPVLRLAVGAMADEALLASLRVVPGRLQGSGYPFRHPELEAALRHVLGRRT